METTPTTKSTPTFSTREFEASHGRRPKGRGSWLFAFDGNGERGRDLDFAELFECNGTFAEARQAALAEGKARGARTCSVCP